jgi:hypothetical protein
MIMSLGNKVLFLERRKQAGFRACPIPVFKIEFWENEGSYRALLNKVLLTVELLQTIRS